MCLAAGVVANPASARQVAPAGFRIACSVTTVAVGWSGTESVSCTVDAAADVDEDVRLSCADLPDGGACRIDPAVVHPKTGAPASATLTISYTERMPAGQHPVRITAVRGDANQTTMITVQKDANTVSATCPGAADVAAIDHDPTFDAAHGGARELSAGT